MREVGTLIDKIRSKTSSRVGRGGSICYHRQLSYASRDQIKKTLTISFCIDYVILKTRRGVNKGRRVAPALAPTVPGLNEWDDEIRRFRTSSERRAAPPPPGTRGSARRSIPPSIPPIAPRVAPWRAPP
jgi:hypothetical protein